ncbi:MAG: IS1634 family transposase [Planctomycetes bacterium]|nr:IS1634 family transposase [Planctomycetota bacterium]
MFLKRINTKSKEGKKRTYWALVKSVRTARGPRHQVVSYLGELRAGEKTEWANLARIVNKRPIPRMPLFDTLEATEPVPDTIEVRVRGARVERTRDFGDVYLALTLWRALELDKLLERIMPDGHGKIPWHIVATVLSLARFCEPSSELHIADTWYQRTSLDDLMGVSADRVNTDRLYRAHDHLLKHKDDIEKHLKERYTTLFDAQYDLLLYDVTSTYFEGEAKRNPQAKRGHSRDHRPDCKQVCIGLVVTREGLPVAYEVFEGNRHDSKTLQEIIEAMEERHGKARRIWVLDRGMVSDENLQFLRDRDGQYIVGTPKATLRSFEQALLDQDWTQVEEGIEVKLRPGPDGNETFIVCRSTARREKEKAMHERFEKRIEEGLQSLERRLDKAKKKPNRSQVERQIGRLLGKNSRAAGLFDIKVSEVERDGADGFLKVTWTKKDAWREWANLSEGCYLLRTNLVDWTAEDLWKTYIQLTQAEAAFRTQKSELNLRPIWHHKEDRVQAHILFSFLAYAMWKMLELWMSRCGLGNGPRPLIEELARIKTNDVVLPTSKGREVRIRCVTQTDESQRTLLGRLGLKIPTRLGEPHWSSESQM